MAKTRTSSDDAAAAADQALLLGSPVLHDGVEYAPGDTLTLAPEQAAALEKAGAVASEEPQA